ncbi:MAG TPA: hypothetical protein VN428_11135 [Bryobacteraceae bacterium]|nr:hypothetical protein [Bryobacteraceae bacterium]
MDDRGWHHVIRPRHSEEDRVESWKEIANYLGRDVRTITRWEKRDGLPVHREPHGRSASVYASKRELDEWRARRAQRAPSQRLRRSAILGVVLLSAAALPFTGLLLTGSREAETLDAKPLTGYPGAAMQPRFSPDGRHVAYTWNGEGEDNFDIYVSPLSAGRPLRLTSDPAGDYSPTWSPDGMKIAFLRYAGPNRASVLIVPALGGVERSVAHTQGDFSWDWSRAGPFLTWAPDGESLIVSGWKEPGKSNELLRIVLATGEIRGLSPRILADSAPAFSPDGKTLAFSRRVSWGVSELCVLDLSASFAPAGEVRRLSTGSSWNTSPAWMPDGRTLVFSSGTMDSTYLARIDVRSPGPSQRLPAAGAYGWHPSIATAPDGHAHLAYTRHFESVNIWRYALGERNTAQRLISSPHWSYEPAYSSDGKRIAFISDRTGFGEIWVADADGRNAAQWTSMKQPRLGSPRWAPDGHRIAFTAPGNQGSSIYLIDGPGATPRLVRGSEHSGYLAWSPDGRAIYYSSDRSGTAEIWKIAPAGGDPIRVTARGGRVPGVPPGGQYLFFLRVSGPGENHLYRMPLAEGAEEKVLDFVDAYSVSQTGVAFKFYRPGLHPIGPLLQWFDIGSGTTERLAEPAKPLRYGVAVSPDSRSLLYAQADYEVTELMLVDNFR